jgi:hypothetical protein
MSTLNQNWTKKIDTTKIKKEEDIEEFVYEKVFPNIPNITTSKDFEVYDIRLNESKGITFDIRLFDKTGILKLHTVSATRKQARRFAKTILKLTRKEE